MLHFAIGRPTWAVSPPMAQATFHRDCRSIQHRPDQRHHRRAGLFDQSLRGYGYGPRWLIRSWPNNYWYISSAISIDVSSLDSLPGHEGEAVSLGPITATNNFNQPVTLSVSSLPTGLTFDPNTGVIGGTIAIGAAQNGPYHVNIHATDGFETADLSVRLACHRQSRSRRRHFTSIALAKASTCPFRPRPYPVPRLCSAPRICPAGCPSIPTPGHHQRSGEQCGSQP